MDRILIVDDDAQLLTILKESLKRFKNKFEVITAEDGLAAIIAIKSQPISAVVTDIRMPIVNGLVLLAYIGKNFPGIPCIVMTEYGTPFLKERLQKEVSYYIEKPFEVTELVQAILSVLGRQEGIEGTVKGISLVGFVQLVEMEYLTCLCEISSRDGEKGYLLFDGGVLYSAFYQNLRGKEAAVSLLQMDGVTIKFKKPPRKKIPRQIALSVSALLGEAKTLKDKMESTERTAAIDIEDADKAVRKGTQ